MVGNYKKVNLIINNFVDKRYGSVWEDFDSYFSPERCAFLIYGNVVTIQSENGLKIAPNFLKKDLEIGNKGYGRKEFTNSFYFGKNRTRKTEIPRIIDTLLTANLWNAILANKVHLLRFL